MPPHLLVYPYLQPHTFGLGPIRTGVLAIRIFKNPLLSTDSSTLGGFEALPLIGSPSAIAAAKGNMDFQWLRGQQFIFGLLWLTALVSILSLIAWLRDRKQWLLFWMASYMFIVPFSALPSTLRLPYSWALVILLWQGSYAIYEVSGWFLLIWLMQLHQYPRLVRTIRLAAILIIVSGFADGALLFLYPKFITEIPLQVADAVLTVPLYLFMAIPAVLVSYAIFKRTRLDFARWLVAILAFLNAMIVWLLDVSALGIRFTHWSFADRIGAPLFTLNSNPINLALIINTLLILSIVYAVIHYTVENRRRQIVLEQEFQSARELQQALIPEDLPSVPGYTFASAYRPAFEVGGDFFQIIPLDGSSAGSTIVLLGDVSGKGLKAAMTVTLIVGAARMLVESTSSPAEILNALNRRLCGHMHGGFATCIVLRLQSDGGCVLASAGHPAPLLNDQEPSIAGAFPLGLFPDVRYEECSMSLKPGDHLALYTDGLLEARNHAGELYSFDRLKALFASNPTATAAAETAVAFGQEDDITVLTFTRLRPSEETSAEHAVPSLATIPA